MAGLIDSGAIAVARAGAPDGSRVGQGAQRVAVLTWSQDGPLMLSEARSASGSERDVRVLHVGGTVAYRHPLWLCGEADGTWSLEPA